ncbi:ADP-ribosylglycohydrolase family protein [Alkalinema sp. FACHB-956]|uniref:ADP-ribosylglycohydrolase family protein n=1 Tax=Alkalinema sp. FACHB-956 TaxID=2692768 RepID=UPI00168430C6|nr:ADP-ribosylglycohydrolase family protein [Alkalinema sp. FACHB-956]MBD2327573.1 ADP-ribosylglycohydrolase family protein [Alkalinema sp. FACHB-956]
MVDRADRIAGGLLGLLVGDALGVPYEFHPPENLPPIDQIEFNPPQGFHRTYAGIAPGTWSDDGAQALCLLASLLECDRFDPDDFGRRLLAWYDDGYLAVDSHVFDVGIHTGRVLSQIRRGVNPLQAGMMDPNAKGNGSLMRSLPIVLWCQGSDRELVELAHGQSQVTHGAITCQVCCALYCLWGRAILEAISNPWPAAVGQLRQMYADNPTDWADHLADLETSVQPEAAIVGQGSGYVVDCLRSARLALQRDHFEEVVKTAIALGNDTDTTACVAGGLAGLHHGIQGIPDRWQQQLRGQEILQPLLDALMQRW